MLYALINLKVRSSWFNNCYNIKSHDFSTRLTLGGVMFTINRHEYHIFFKLSVGERIA